MSKQYDKYLDQHCKNVGRGCKWIYDNVGAEAVGNVLSDISWERVKKLTKKHDASKFDAEEYSAYDKYFYGGEVTGEELEKIQKNFNYAWLHHIHNNPHHWQYWVLVNDDKELGSVALEMPDDYILEMICDWWTFSWRKGDLYEIFNWWNEHTDYILLGEETRAKVVKMLNLILDKVNELGGEVDGGEAEESNEGA